jgi:hypothetical protein
MRNDKVKSWLISLTISFVFDFFITRPFFVRPVNYHLIGFSNEIKFDFVSIEGFLCDFLQIIV